MSIIRWENPPPPATGNKGRTKEVIAHELIAIQLRRKPGEWALIFASTVANTASIASAIKAGDYRAYKPRGTYDAVWRNVEGEGRIYARYLSEQDSHDQARTDSATNPAGGAS